MFKRARLTWACFLAAGLLWPLALCALYLLPNARVPRDKARLGGYSVEELIDGLQDENSEGLGTHSTAWADGFLASDEAPKFRGRVLGSAMPAVSPVLRELTRRGVPALPALMAHLEDRRPTRLVVKLPFGLAGGMWHSDEYDCRYSDPAKQAPSVNTGRETGVISGKYRVRVGDLCFVVVGQMVNRHLNVARYQPSACLVINSPVKTPALAAAVRADWTGLTADEHKRSLLADAQDPFEHGRAAALVRLRFYYPDAAARLALRDDGPGLP
jgi:hypothetical protein